MDKYELIKSIRFKLKPISLHDNFSKDDLESYQNKDPIDKSQITTFLANCEQCIFIFIKFVFNNNSTQKTKALNNNSSDSKNNTNSSNLSLSKGVTIKSQWLRSHTKSDFFNTMKNNNQKNYLIKSIPYLNNTFKNFLEEWDSITGQLKKIVQAPEESLKRKSETALLINYFSTKKVFIFLKDFVYYSNQKTDEKLKNELETQLNHLEESLNKIKNHCRASQSPGVMLAKSSLNLYTVNKKPTNYDKKIEELKKELKDPFVEANLRPFHKMIKQWLQNTKNENNKPLIETNNLNQLNVQEWYSLIKAYKSNTRQLFNNDIDQIISSPKKSNLNYEKMQTKYPLFSCSKKQYDQYIENRTKIQKLNQPKNNSKKNTKNIHSNKQRNALNTKNKEFFNRDDSKHKILCKCYENIAKKYGKIKNDLLAIEREKHESQLLNFWAVILEEREKHYLLLIHRNDMSNIKTQLDQITTVPEEPLKLHVFSSLTLRALDKLCFSVDSEFLKEIKQELPKYENIHGKFSFIDQQIINEKKLIQFYQDVLNTSYASKVLDKSLMNKIKSINILNKNFSSVNEFRSSLEKECYLKKMYVIDNSFKETLLNNYRSNLFEITSFDLTTHNKEIKIKPHTKLWKTFWEKSNEEANYPTRINPEMSILWRNKLEDKLEFFKSNLENLTGSYKLNIL